MFRWQVELYARPNALCSSEKVWGQKNKQKTFIVFRREGILTRYSTTPWYNPKHVFVHPLFYKAFAEAAASVAIWLWSDWEHHLAWLPLATRVRFYLVTLNWYMHKCVEHFRLNKLLFWHISSHEKLNTLITIWSENVSFPNSYPL